MGRTQEQIIDALSSTDWLLPMQITMQINGLRDKPTQVGDVTLCLEGLEQKGLVISKPATSIDRGKKIQTRAYKLSDEAPHAA